MSFANPVNEPVKRFKSTDASAPQINYNARTAGDVKAVLKACLVTGYGAKASAGWTAINETATVIEFVSPSAAMSDYRLGIDDSTTTKTDWYYQYQDARVNPAYNNPNKVFAAPTDRINAANGWQLMVTEQGVIFIELVQNTVINKLAARITYWGRVKSALIDNTGSNIMFFNIGYAAAIPLVNYFYSSNTYIHTNLATYTSANVTSVTSNALSQSYSQTDLSVVDLVGDIYLSNASKDLIIGKLPPILSKTVANSSDAFGVSEHLLDGRNVLSVCAGYIINSTATMIINSSRTFLIYLDYWEY